MTAKKDMGGVVGALRQTWQMGATAVAVLTAVFASFKPEFSFSTKFSFGSFLLRVYWPELLVGAAVIVAIVCYLRATSSEPPRILRRLQSLRGWSHEEVSEVFARGARARGAHGVRAPR